MVNKDSVSLIDVIKNAMRISAQKLREKKKAEGRKLFVSDQGTIKEILP